MFFPGWDPTSYTFLHRPYLVYPANVGRTGECTPQTERKRDSEVNTQKAQGFRLPNMISFRCAGISGIRNAYSCIQCAVIFMRHDTLAESIGLIVCYYTITDTVKQRCPLQELFTHSSTHILIYNLFREVLEASNQRQISGLPCREGLFRN